MPPSRPARNGWCSNAPNNPTGAAYDAEQLAALAEVLRRHPHVWVFSDEIYEHLRYDGLGSISIASVAPDLADRVLVMSGVSKTYAMTGWRIGFCGGPAGLIRAMAVVQGPRDGWHLHRRSGGGGGGARRRPGDGGRDGRGLSPAARSGCGSAAGRARHHLRGCRRAPSTSSPPSRAASGVSAPADGQSRPTATSRWALLEERHVAVVHGAAFGMSPHVRISYATDDASLEEACRRIIGFCETLH